MSLGLRARFKIYRELSKSGIVFLVLISTAAGYLLGQPHGSPLNLWRMGATLMGLLLLGSGSSALNQFQDREMDAAMVRTATRPLPSGRLSAAEALVFSTLTMSGGLVVLFVLDPILSLLGVSAVFFYNFLYTLWWKRKHSYAAVPGAIPGAMPILIGFASASGSAASPGAWYLFAILFFWQMPHFWVLAVRYKDDYALGGVPTLPVARGAAATRLQISVWCLAYVALSMLAPLYLPGLATFYLTVGLVTSAWVLSELWRYLRAPEGLRWLRFFLAVNLSLIIYLAAAVADDWRYVIARDLYR